jgi:hypothetical protein
VEEMKLPVNISRRVLVTIIVGSIFLMIASQAIAQEQIFQILQRPSEDIDGEVKNKPVVSKIPVPMSAENQPPIVKFGHKPKRPLINDEITFFAGVRDDGRVIKYEWEFGDGNEGEGIIIKHSYSSEGTYQVKLRVYDNLGAWSEIKRNVTVYSISPNQPPNADFFIYRPRILVTGIDTLFISTSTDPDGVIVAHKWYVNDEFVSDSKVLHYTFNKPGNYTIKLRIKDDEEAWGKIEKEITVRGFITT